MRLGTLRGRAVEIDGDRAPRPGAVAPRPAATLASTSRSDRHDDGDRLVPLRPRRPGGAGARPAAGVRDRAQLRAACGRGRLHAARAPAGLHEVPVLHHRTGHHGRAARRATWTGRSRSSPSWAGAARHIAEADAWDALAGVTGGQDLSERLLQLSGRPAAVLARQVARRVRTDRALDRDPGRARRPDDIALRLDPRRRAAPVRPDRRPDLLDPAASSPTCRRCARCCPAT